MKKKSVITAVLCLVLVVCAVAGVALAAGGYVNKLTIGHIKEGNEITLPTNEPEKDGFVFKGWQVEGQEEVYEAGETVTVDQNLADGATNITFKPVWKEENRPWTVKYAVRIYGIEEDVDEEGDPIGLTFGSAGGYSKIYKDSYAAHSDGKDCLHNLTWAEIIEKAHSDPHFLHLSQNHLSNTILYLSL